MARYKMLAGSGELFGKSYKTGDIIDTPADLMSMFPNKFEKVQGIVVTEAPKPVSKVGEEEEGSDPSAGEENPAGAGVAGGDPPSGEDAGKEIGGEGLEEEAKAKGLKGKDVTKNFPRAVDEDFRVVKRNKHYFVYDADDLSKVLNTKGLKKVEVDDFINASLEG